jgi:citrate synthase
VFSRAIGLVGHIVEETRNPMARQMKKMIETEALAHFQTDQP